MAERPEDLNLPITVVQRIIKESLPDGVIVSKEARQTICRASSVFVLYLTSCAVAHANKSKRKTLAINDIMSAIDEMEFEAFVQPLNEILQYRKSNIGQKSKSAAGKKDSKNEEMAEEEEIEEQEEANGNEDGEDEVEEENLDEESGRKNKKRKTGQEDDNGDEEPNEDKNSDSSDSEDGEPEERID